MEGLITEYQLTGPCQIDVDTACEKWNHLWVLLEWRANDSWRLVKHLRKDSPITQVKVSISRDQAKEIRDRLGLVGVQTAFKSGVSYRRKTDWKMLWEMEC